MNFGYVKSELDVTSLFENQERFFREVHGTSLPCLRGVRPKTTPGFFGAVVMADWMTNDGLLNCLSEFTSTDGSGRPLDEYFTRHIRDPKRDGSYMVLCRGGQEGDLQHAGMSPREALRHGVVGMTLGERLALEIWYRWWYGKNKVLDCGESSILCIGSKSVDGMIPRVFSHSVSMRFAIRKFPIDGRGSPALRFREVAPFMPPKPRARR